MIGEKGFISYNQYFYLKELLKRSTEKYTDDELDALTMTEARKLIARLIPAKKVGLK